VVAKVSEARPLRSRPGDAVPTRTAPCPAQGSNVLQLTRVWKPEPGDDFVCAAVDAGHFLDLRLSFAVIELVDTDGVDEEQSIFAPRRCSSKEVKEVSTDEKWLAIDLNLLNITYSVRVAPGIGERFVMRPRKICERNDFQVIAYSLTRFVR
jgi:hypothetical protein